MARAPAGESGRSRKGPGVGQRVTAWGADHARAAVGALGRLARTRLASGMTAAVLGISLALPAAFLLLLNNVEEVTGDWEGSARISLFLQVDMDESAYRGFAEEVAQRSDVQAVEVVGPDEALDEFQALSGMDDAVGMLDDNPLPPLVVVQPGGGLDAAAVERLTGEFQALEPVDTARLDLEWVQRLHAIMELLRRAVWLIAALLGLTVVMVVGNTIRLAIENRREEIVITKLIGATDAFVRRPFLYEGAWYGLIGGALASLLVESGRLVLREPVGRLADLYETGPLLSGLGLQGIGLVWGAGVALGLAGSWLAVSRHLAAIEPR